MIPTKLKRRSDRRISMRLPADLDERIRAAALALSADGYNVNVSFVAMTAIKIGLDEVAEVVRATRPMRPERTR